MPVQRITPFVTDYFFRNYTPSSAPYVPPVSRTATRGILIEKNEQDINRALVFQFNPTEIEDTKSNEFFTRVRTGLAHPDTIWISGGANELSFSLFLDATADSNTPHFGRKTQYGKDTYETLRNVDGVDLIELGTLPQVERLKSFFYPKQIEPTAPRFVTNNIQQNNSARTSDQFIPPPTLIFVYGPIYLECRMTSLSVKHETFNYRLAPVRTRAEVKLTINENAIVKTSPSVLNAAYSGLPQNPPNYTYPETGLTP